MMEYLQRSASLSSSSSSSSSAAALIAQQFATANANNFSLEKEFENLFNSSSSSQFGPNILNSNNFFNDSDSGNVTVFNAGYPSGYTLPQIIIASIIVTILMIIIVIGNMLVIIAISTEKSLKNIQNWFIASLAVADFFLGLVIMPFSLANELMGYWIFGSWWCDIHSAMDVLLCTASINNLCLISLDRYWSITKAVEYLKTRTPQRAAIMIATVWIVSAVVCIPPLLGWKVDMVEVELPKCRVSEDLGYVLYSALGSFYIPSCIMVFVYIRIYFAAKRRARRGIKKFRKSQTDQVTSFTSNSINPNNNIAATMIAQTAEITQISTIDPLSQNDPLKIPIVTCDLASDPSPNDNATDLDNQCDNKKHTLKVNALITTHLSATVELRHAAVALNGSNSPTKVEISPTLGRCRALSVGIDSDMISEFEPSSSDSGVARRCAVVKPRKFRLYQSIFRNQNASQMHTQAADMAELEPALPKMTKPRDPEKEKRRIARKKEKRATLILGIIMGSFIACWLPFFFLYILIPACDGQCKLPSNAFKVAFWLGYMNSAFNPVIYTIFNKDFRRAFRRILVK